MRYLFFFLFFFICFFGLGQQCQVKIRVTYDDIWLKLRLSWQLKIGVGTPLVSTAANCMVTASADKGFEQWTSLCVNTFSSSCVCHVSIKCQSNCQISIELLNVNHMSIKFSNINQVSINDCQMSIKCPSIKSLPTATYKSIVKQTFIIECQHTLPKHLSQVQLITAVHIDVISFSKHWLTGRACLVTHTLLWSDLIINLNIPNMLKNLDNCSTKRRRVDFGVCQQLLVSRKLFWVRAMSSN